jgi:hypothetical protein
MTGGESRTNGRAPRIPSGTGPWVNQHWTLNPNPFKLFKNIANNPFWVSDFKI